MTNRELLIGILSDPDFFDDGGAIEESEIYYHINCPYFSEDSRAECRNTMIDRGTCYRCKCKWLDSEVDE